MVRRSLCDMQLFNDMRFFRSDVQEIRRSRILYFVRRLVSQAAAAALCNHLSRPASLSFVVLCCPFSQVHSEDQMFREIQIFKYSHVQIFKCSHVQIFKCSHVQTLKCSHGQIFTCADFQALTCAEFHARDLSMSSAREWSF